MKRTLLLLLFVVLFIGVKSQDKTILVTENNLPYTSQTWFFSGVGNSLQESSIKKNWDEGRRIISVAYTNNGWFVTMAKNTGIGMQTYSYSADWPDKWINNNWNDEYRLTSISRGNGRWCVVMSKGSGYTAQTWNRNTWSEIVKWSEKNRNEGFFITDMAYDGSCWTVVMSKDSQYLSQDYLMASSYDDLVSKINKEIWDKSYRIQLLEYGGGSYLVVYGNYSKDNGRGQSFSVNSSNIGDFIDKKWAASQNIAYVGGGYSNMVAHNGNVASNQRNLGKRTGRFYYINESHQQASLNFYWNNGNYLVESSTLGMGYGWIPRYVLKEETSNEYIFKQAKVYLNGNVEVMDYQPTMIISKGWDRIILHKSVMGKDLILTKEVSKDEYDKISQAKSNFYNSFGGGHQHHQHNNNGNNDNGASYVDGPCKYCGGGGGCSSCNGTGLKYNPYSGHYETCPSCRGNKQCFNCRGTGKQATY